MIMGSAVSPLQGFGCRFIREEGFMGFKLELDFLSTVKVEDSQRSKDYGGLHAPLSRDKAKINFLLLDPLRIISPIQTSSTSLTNLTWC